jgi:hypothetical protein
VRPSFLENSFCDVKKIIDGYGAVVRDRMKAGWSGYLMTFMFNSLRGSPFEKNEQMKGEIAGVHSSLVTRVIRKPRADDANLPILFCAPDWPVAKRNKKPLSQVITNDGLHHHGILLIAPADRHSRLKLPVDQHFRDLQHYYTRDRLLLEVDARQFLEVDAHKVTDYALKGLKTTHLSYDDAMLLLPSNHPSRRPYIKALAPSSKDGITDGQAEVARSVGSPRI